ncbi:MAG: peptide ABC transporter substrate-binding protein, partial [Clostridia bacterium]|nr:peptide ABC transporter substrate-binding protein [Clostridia bacterium]
MYFVKRVAALLCTAVLMFMMSACGNDPQDAVIYFELSEKPATLDAQVALSDSEIVVVNSIYEGLLRHNESGAVVCAACERYSLDGLVYTFYLKNDLRWSNDTPVTADDF